MQREDWEIHAVNTTGTPQQFRVTREIQHDHSPRFLTDRMLLAVMGEGRHQRSYMYDLRNGTRTRLHHNNSVRTVAPEYDWAVSPDGSRVAIVAERDGDTVTPHRHLWLMDLNTKVTRQQLIARVDSNLTAERALRANGRRMFAPIAAQVSAAVKEVNIGRIYDYEKTLFSFDSKNITQPGNWRATEWLEETYRSFGIETRLQRFTTVQGREIEVANVIAMIPGTVNPELVYVVGAHFDSRAEGPGADDNTSGTAMILEAARVIASRPLPASVMFVSFTGEESGLRGAREFGRRMKDSITASTTPSAIPIPACATCSTRRRSASPISSPTTRSTSRAPTRRRSLTLGVTSSRASGPIPSSAIRTTTRRTMCWRPSTIASCWRPARRRSRPSC